MPISGMSGAARPAAAAAVAVSPQITAAITAVDQRCRCQGSSPTPPSKTGRIGSELDITDKRRRMDERPRPPRFACARQSPRDIPALMRLKRLLAEGENSLTRCAPAKPIGCATVSAPRPVSPPSSPKMSRRHRNGDMQRARDHRLERPGDLPAGSFRRPGTARAASPAR